MRGRWGGVIETIAREMPEDNQNNYELCADVVAKETSPLPYSHSADDPYRENITASISNSSDDEDEGEGSFNIDWAEVEAGKAAGIPGQWEAVPVAKEMANNDLGSLIGDDLCKALQIKAAAYSDEDWQKALEHQRTIHPCQPLEGEVPLYTPQAGG